MNTQNLLIAIVLALLLGGMYISFTPPSSLKETCRLIVKYDGSYSTLKYSEAVDTCIASIASIYTSTGHWHRVYKEEGREVLTEILKKHYRFEMSK